MVVSQAKFDTFYFVFTQMEKRKQQYKIMSFKYIWK